MANRNDSFIGSVSAIDPIPPPSKEQQQVTYDLRTLFSNFTQNPTANILSQRCGSSKVSEHLQILRASEEPIHPSLISILRDLLFVIEHYEGITDAHRLASEIVIKNAKGIKIAHSRSQDIAGEVNSVNISQDDRFLAIGSCTESTEGALQIWELCTGRCINKMTVDCGFVSQGLLQWNQTFTGSPLEQRYHLALNTDTNAIKAFDAFSNISTCIYDIVGYEGNSRPSDWDWCPKYRCIVSSCIVACLYDEDGKFSPEKEYDLFGDDYVIDKNLPCPHFRKLENKKRKTKKDPIDEKIIEDNVTLHSLSVLVEKYIIKSGLISTIKDSSLPEVVANRLFSSLVGSYHANVHDTHFPPSRTYFGDGKPPEYAYARLSSLSLDKTTFVFDSQSHLLGYPVNAGVPSELNVRAKTDPTRFCIWKKVENKIQISSLSLDYSPYCMTVSPHGTHLAVTRLPEANEHKTDVWLIYPSKQLLCTITHPVHPIPSYGNQVDPHYRLPICWANSGEFDTSLFYVYYNQEGADIPAPEKLFVWNSFTGQLMGSWSAIRDNSIACPVTDDDQCDDEDEDEEEHPSSAVKANPIFWYYCQNLKDWRRVAIFASGLVVVPEEDNNQILKYDVNFVLNNQLAWPLNWCVGTSVLEICNSWTAAQKSSKFPKDCKTRGFTYEKE